MLIQASARLESRDLLLHLYKRTTSAAQTGSDCFEVPESDIKVMSGHSSSKSSLTL